MSTVCKVYQLPLRTIENRVIFLEALGRDSLCAPISSTAVHEKARAFVLNDNSFTPQILLSNNDFWSLVTGGPQNDGEHRFLPSIIGPIYLPALSTNTRLPITNSTHLFLTADTSPSTKLEVDYTQNHYSVKLPFQLIDEPENDHYFLALHRLRSTYKKLEQTPEMLEEYNEQIQKLIIDKVAEVVPSFYPNSNKQLFSQRFLAHHPTFHPQKGKMRIVFDGSARTNTSKSINEMLLTGDNLLPRIWELLVEMRSLKKFLIADIHAAFHNVVIDQDHRRFVKFIWLKNHRRPPLNSNLMYLQFAKLPFGLTCSPFILAYCLREHLLKYGDFGKEIAKRTYVDNILVPIDNFADAVKKFEEMHRIFNKASMPLHEFMSNDKEVNLFLEKEGNKIKSPASFLGVTTDFDKDEFIHTIPPLPDQPLTKRRVSSILASVFDPLGVLEPALLPIKQFLQRLWIANTPWDTPLAESLVDEFKHITATWGTTSIRVPRLYNVKEAVEIHLHGFADASKHAKGAVCFLTVKMANGTTAVHFVAAKSRLTPTKNVQTIPVLEFSAILLTAQLLDQVRSTLRHVTMKTILWSDNSAALHWAMKDAPPKSPIYVRNRHPELSKILKDVDLKHVPGNLNPADVGSRGCSLQQLDISDWTKGPQWILDSNLWPVQHLDILNTVDNPPEIHSATMLVGSAPDTPTIPWTKFSSWRKVNRIAALCFTFMAKKSPKFAQKFNLNDLRNPNTNDVERSRLIFPLLLKGIQAERPPTEKERSNWALFEDERGLLRQRTRVRMAADPAVTLNPIFMPRDHPLTRAYLFQIHERHAHSSREYTYNASRNHTFIPKARPIINDLVESCHHCKRFHARPFKLPSYPPFPESRTQPSSPFTHTGVDLFGPIYLKPTTTINNETQRKRGRPPAPIREKAYGVILACFSTRAIHLELVNSQTPEAFLHAFRRFCSRRGAPRTILSDQALNFTTTAALFTADPSNGSYQPISSMSAFLTNANINWRFTPALAPWHGASYERLIHTVKTSFHRAIGRRVLDVDSCRTLLTEIEYIVNKRPITYVSNDNAHTLTPADFLNLTQNDPPYVESDEQNSLSDADFNPDENDESGRQKLLKYWQASSDLTTRFWNLWKHSYITQLQSRLKTEHHHPRLVNTEPPKINEIVLVNDESLPRNAWKLGRITALNSTPYRSATVDVGQPNGTTRQISRPINKLSSLELRAFTTVLVLLSLCTICSPCSEIASLSAISRECTQSDNETLACNFRSSVRFSLTPRTQELCLQFKYEENSTIASELLIITPMSLQLTCAPTTLGYSSDVKFRTAHSHRCDRGDGSQCFYNFCESVKKETPLTDLNNEANDHFGYSYCYRSCGWCNGCGLLSSSCLFYRSYILPNSATHYHLFNCLSFSPKVSLTVTQGNMSEIVNLIPTFPQDFQDIMFTVSSTSINPLPILHQTFLTNLRSNETFLLPVSVLAARPNPLTVSCASPDAAQTANCSFPPDHCSCTPDNFNPHCTCLSFDFSAAEKANPKLPVAREGTTLSLVDNNLIANTTQPIELQITVNTTVDMVIQRTTCKIKFVKITGCFNCEESPSISLTCHTSFGKTTATIKCPTVTVGAFLCGTNSSAFHLPFTATQKEINEKCEVKCSRTIEKIHIHGQLAEKIIQPNTGKESDQERIDHEVPGGIFGEVWEAISGFFSNLLSNYKIILIIVGLLALLGLLIIGGCYATPLLTLIYHCLCPPRPSTPSFTRHARIRLSRLA